MTRIRLHLGCGRVHLPGRLNVDAFQGTAADLRASGDLLPLRSRSVESIEAYQLIEHLGYLGTLDALAEWHRVLVPGGRLVLETPDIEPSFRRFLGGADLQTKAEALNWIFGHETPGYAHLFLFPRDALVPLLVRLGFVEPRLLEPRTHLYAPGFRVEAARGADPVHEALALTRTDPAVRAILRGLDQVARLEVEETVFDVLERASRLRLQGDESAAAALFRDATVVAAPVVARYAQVVESSEPWARTARLCAALGLAPRLWAHLRERAVAHRGQDGFEATRERAIRLLEWADNNPAGDLEARLRSELPSDPEGVPCGPALLTRAAANVLCQDLIAHGVRFLNLGLDAEAEPLLRRAAALEIQPFYAFANLGVLAARRAAWTESAHWYKRALDLGGPGVLADLVREEIALVRGCAEGRPADPPPRARAFGLGEGFYAADLG